MNPEVLIPHKIKPIYSFSQSGTLSDYEIYSVTIQKHLPDKRKYPVIVNQLSKDEYISPESVSNLDTSNNGQQIIVDWQRSLPIPFDTTFFNLMIDYYQNKKDTVLL